MAPDSILDSQFKTRERIRRLEVMGQSKTIKPREWHPTDDVTDGLTRLVIAISPWATFAETDGTVARTPFPSMSGFVQRLHALLSDPYTGWNPDTAEAWNDFMVLVGAMPMAYLSLNIGDGGTTGLDHRPSYLMGAPLSEEVIADGSGHNTYNKFVWVYGLMSGEWFYAPPGYTESNASRLTDPPLPGESHYIDDPERFLWGGGSYVRVPANKLPWTNTFFIGDNAIAALIPVSQPCGNTPIMFEDWPKPDGSGEIAATGFLGIECADYESFFVAPESGQLMGLITQPGDSCFSVTIPSKVGESPSLPVVTHAPGAEAHDHIDGYPGFAEVRRRVEKFAPLVGGGEPAAWAEAWAGTASIKEDPEWQVMEHFHLLRGRVEATVRDKHVYFRGFLHHPWEWDNLPVLFYFYASEVPPPPYRPYPFVAFTENNEAVRCTADHVFGDWYDRGLWAVYANIQHTHPLFTKATGSNQVRFDGLSWLSNELLY